jgi:hypothetical protein
MIEENLTMKNRARKQAEKIPYPANSACLRARFFFEDNL